MRPVNLIPLEDRHGERAPLRTGPSAYVIVGLLALALIGVVAVVLTGNKISDRQADVASLKSQVATAQAEADRLSTYTNFAAMQQARNETVASLAKSRFDWERVLREVAIVIPDDVWLTNVTAQATPDTGPSSSPSPAVSSDSITGPSIDIQGCSHGHTGVAKFLAALRDVDGVTRVSVISSDRPNVSNSTDTGGSSTSPSGGDGNTVSCSSYKFISTFEVVAAFDAVQPDGSSTPAPAIDGSAGAQPTSDQPAGGDSQSQQSGAPSTAVVSGTGGTP